VLTIRAHFDGEKVILPENLRGIDPCDVFIVFQNGRKDDPERSDWMKAQEASFVKVWDNDEDAVYDEL
jgi:hypothetical protein